MTDSIPALRSSLRFLVLLALLNISTSVHAQSTTGDLHLLVVDSLGTALPGVNVTVAGAVLQGVRGAITDDNGRCAIIALPPGEIAVRLSHPAFQPLVIEHVQIRLGKTVNLGTLALHQRVLEMHELVVLANPLEADINTTTYGSTLRPAEIETLPLDRNYKEMITMLPLSNYSFFGDGVSIGGSTGFENKYFVDGVEVTDPLTQTGGTSLPYNFIKEIEVTAGGYDAEYRGALGGGLNVVTYTGSNEFHGTLFGFYTSNRLALDPRIGLADPTSGGLTTFDVGGSLGGPIIRDDLWFFAAYNPSFTRRDVEIPGFGTYVDKVMVNSFAGKLSWRASERLSITATMTGDPLVQRAIGNGVGVPPTSLTSPDTYLMDIASGGLNLSVSATYLPVDHLLVEGSLARVVFRATGGPSTVLGQSQPRFIDVQSNAWSGGPPSRWDSFRSATIGRAAATLTAGGHVAKIGFEYKVNGTDNRWKNHNIVMFASDYFGEYVSEGMQNVSDRIPSVFLQDAWQITDNLNIHGGIRWDGQSILDPSGRVVQTITVPLQPRVGVVYAIDAAGDQKISASFGRYAQEFALFQAMSMFSDEGYDYGLSYTHDPRISRAGADTLWYTPFAVSPPIDGLRGQYFDEFTIGFEQAFTRKVRFRVQGVFRTLRETIDDAFIPSAGRFAFGNPGRGELSNSPRPERKYTAAVITVEQSGDQRFDFTASYILSRTHGNYGGLFDPVYRSPFPNATLAFDDPSNAREFGTGLLPNDRTHVLKLTASYRFSDELSAGIFFTAQSGTPLSEYISNGLTWILRKPQGSSGRTPAIWDLNARIAFDLPFTGISRVRLILDLSHIASQRTPVDFDQFLGTLDGSGQLAYPNPNHGKVYRYQPPMSLRLGLDVKL